MRHLIRAASVAALVVLGSSVIEPSRALPGLVVSVRTEMPTRVTVGDSLRVGTISIERSLTALPATVTVTSIKLWPSCGDVLAPCDRPDPGVLAIGNVGQGTAGVCAGQLFSVSPPDAEGMVTLSSSEAIVLRPLRLQHFCTIQFTFDVADMPTFDAGLRPGVQTATSVVVEGRAEAGPVTVIATTTGTDLVTVDRVRPTLSTQASPPVQVGGQVWDTARLENGLTPTGVITFRLFPPDDVQCRQAVFTSTTPVSGNGDYVSGPYTTVDHGTYRWIATYSGDAINASVSGACNDPGESVTVLPPPTTTSTTTSTSTTTTSTSTTTTSTLPPTTTSTTSTSSTTTSSTTTSTTTTSTTTTVPPTTTTSTTTTSTTTTAPPTTTTSTTTTLPPTTTTSSTTTVPPTTTTSTTTTLPPTTTTSSTTTVPPTTTSSTTTSTTTTLPPTATTSSTTTVPPTTTSTTTTSSTTTVPPTTTSTTSTSSTTTVPPTTTSSTTTSSTTTSSTTTTTSTTTTVPPTTTSTTTTVPPTTTLPPTAMSISPAAATPSTLPPTTTLPTTSTTVASTTTAVPSTTATAPTTTSLGGQPLPPPPPTSERGRDDSEPKRGLRRYLPEAHAEDVVDLQIAAFTLLALLTGAGSNHTRRHGGGEQREAGELVGTDVEAATEGLEAFEEHADTKWGDASETWRWAATPFVDRLSRRWPECISHRSPLVARIINDAGYLRAMFGSASVVLPVLGVVLGVAAVRDVGGESLPPSFALAMALAVLGVFDALAGIVSVTVFVTGVLLSGGVASADAARTLLGLATLWFAAPLIAGTARPLRRPPTTTFEEHFDRTADVVIASLVGAWAVLTILEGLPGLSGLDLPIAERASAGALVVLAALILRLLVETAAAHLYPRRLAQVQPAELAEPGRGQRIAASVLVLVVFLFVAVSYLGSCWQLYVGGALFILPRILDLVSDHLPSCPRVQVVTPRGIVQVVVLLAIGVVLAAVVLSRLESGRELIRDSFALLALPGAVMAVLELVCREAPEREFKWKQQLLGGLPLIAVGILLALGVIG